MVHSYTFIGNYKGKVYKIVSANICQKDVCNYGAFVEVNGVKRHARIGTRENVFDNIDDAINAAKRFIDSVAA